MRRELMEAVAEMNKSVILCMMTGSAMDLGFAEEQNGYTYNFVTNSSIISSPTNYIKGAIDSGYPVLIGMVYSIYRNIQITVIQLTDYVHISSSASLK